MRDIYKNPTLYYVLVPIVVALWPLLVWAVYLPDAKNTWQEEESYYEKDAKNTITEILDIDTARLGFADSNTSAAEFDYGTAVDKIAAECEIPLTQYNYGSGMVITSGGQKSQTGKVKLNKISIVTFAEFLSTMQFRWADLQCTKITLRPNKGLPDTWDVELDFKYYY